MVSMDKMVGKHFDQGLVTPSMLPRRKRAVKNRSSLKE